MRKKCGNLKYKWALTFISSLPLSCRQICLDCLCNFSRVQKSTVYLLNFQPFRLSLWLLSIFSFYLSVHFPISLNMYLSIYFYVATLLYMHLSSWLSFCLAISLYLCLSIYLLIHRSMFGVHIYLAIYRYLICAEQTRNFSYSY